MGKTYYKVTFYGDSRTIKKLILRMHNRKNITDYIKFEETGLPIEDITLVEQELGCKLKVYEDKSSDKLREELSLFLDYIKNKADEMNNNLQWFNANYGKVV